MNLRLRSLPAPIIVLALIFLALPVLGYFATAAANQLPAWRMGAVLNKFTVYNYAVFLCSFLIAVGLMRIAKWAYYLFFVFVGLLIAFNLYQLFLVLAGSPGLAPGGRPLTLTDLGLNSALIVLGAGAMFYFLQKEISAPYLSLTPRGFRRHMRETLPMPVRWETADDESVAGETISENISTTGCLIPVGPDSPLRAGTRLKLQLILHHENAPEILDARGEVIRILPPPREDPEAPGGAGIRFHFTKENSEARRRLRDFLAERFAPRYRATNVLQWRFADGDEAGQESSARLFNISSGGAYLQSERLPDAGRKLHLEIEYRAGHLTGSAQVRWTNSGSQWGKPKGFGVEFETLSPRFAFFVWLLKLRWGSFRIR